MIWKISAPTLLAATLLLLTHTLSAQQFFEQDYPPGSERAPLRIPLASGPLTIDGKLTEPFWQQASVISLGDSANGQYSPAGETRICVRGKFLCLNSRIPYSGRLMVHATGANAAILREDFVTWKIYSASPLSKRNAAIYFTVNPAGAFSALQPENFYTAGRVDIFNSVDPPASWAKDALVAASIEDGFWNVEAALPLEQFGPVGFLSVERYNAPRPESPELRWYWPAAHLSKNYALPADSASESAPALALSSAIFNEPIIKRAAPSAALPAAIAALPTTVWNAVQRDSLEVKKMLEKFIMSKAAAIAKAEKTEWKKVNTLRDWEQFRDKRMDALRKWLGPMPERTPLHAVISSRRDYDEGYVVENIIFESRPHLPVTANLYLPAKPGNSIPAIVIVHSHHFPKTQIELQEMGIAWARAGAAVLVMDQLCAGERFQSQPWRREGYFARYALGNQLYLAGESLIKWMAWDIIRGIDLLAERPYIDQQRIAMIGAVAGGGEPAALAAAIDSRVAAAVIFSFGKSGSSAIQSKPLSLFDAETANPVLGGGDWETTRKWPFTFSGQFFPWLICASIAPRKLVYASELKWQQTVEEEIAWGRYKKVFGLYNAGGHLAEVHGYGPFPGPGECNNVGVFHRRQIDQFFNQWLHIPVTQTEFRRQLPESDLACLTPELYATFQPRTASALALDIARKKLEASRSRLEKLSAGERGAVVRKELSRLLGNTEPGNIKGTSMRWEKKYAGFTLKAFVVGVEKGISLPVFLLTPLRGPARKPCVLAIAEGGKEKFLQDRSEEIAALLDKGIAVCLPDIRGLGELSADSSRGPDAMDMESVELMLGGTLTGSRLRDMRTIFRWLSASPGIQPGRIALWGDSFSSPNAAGFQFDQSDAQRPGPAVQRQAEPLGGFLAALTALYEDKAIACATNGMLVSFQSALEDRFCHIPQDAIVPGMLGVADLADIIHLIQPRPVYLQGLVDGRNIAVDGAVATQQYGQPSAALTVGDEKNKPPLAAWLTAQCLK